MKVLIVGRGKVGTALAAKLRDTPHKARLVAARPRAPRVGADVDLVVLAVRDGALASLAQEMADAHPRGFGAAVVHVAGALGAGVLGPLRGVASGVGRAHPLASFASKRAPPELRGALWLVDGDRVAVARARRLGRALGLEPRKWPGLPPDAYHAAAALTAGGTAALVAAGVRLLAAHGVPSSHASRALAALLLTVAENVRRVGFPTALTGPVRRGDAATVRRHLAAAEAQSAEIADLYRSVGRAQLSLARAIADVDDQALRRVARALEQRPRRRPRG
jgi:predicted short-subunit dehydrogenase-like oxidoreductase (DUF2520 family)